MQGDSRDLVFCNFGLLRTPDRLDEIVRLLPEARQAEMRKLIENSKGVSAGELKERLHQCRVASISDALERASKTMNGRIERAPAALQRWIVALNQEQHGRENH